MNVLLITKTRTEIVKANKPQNLQDYMRHDGFFRGWQHAFTENGDKVYFFTHSSFFLPANFAYRFLTIYRGLRFLFKKIGLFHFDNYFLNWKIARIVKRYGITMILTETNDFLSPASIKRRIKMSCVFLQWFGVYPEMVGRYVKRFFREYDHILVPCDLGGELDSIVAPHKIIFTPVAYSERVYYHDFNSQYAYDVVFVGNIGSAHSNRGMLLERIAEEFDHFAFFGGGEETLPRDSILRKKHKGYTSPEAIRQIYSSAKIAINLTLNDYHRVKRGINERAVAVPACRGALQIMVRVEGVHAFFNEGEDIVCFNCVDELIEAIRFYLANESERKKIVKNAYVKNLANTYSCRLQHLQKQVREMS